MVIGLITIPDSNFFTCATWAACSGGVKLRWMTPMPPACAMAMASRSSVTVSMADDNSGMVRRKSLANRTLVSASVGNTSE
jgi:hypothetical protein